MPSVWPVGVGGEMSVIVVQVWTKTDSSLQMPRVEADGVGCSIDWSP